jgi:hypothetical protein
MRSYLAVQPLDSVAAGLYLPEMRSGSSSGAWMVHDLCMRCAWLARAPSLADGLGSG